jgi:uncharacterized membrane protein
MKEIMPYMLLGIMLVMIIFVVTDKMRDVKKTTILLILIIAVGLSGCAMLQPKKPFIHKGYVCYTNATIVEVKNAREQLKFIGAAIKPDKKKMCDVVLRTDQNETMTASREGYIECSTNTVNARVTVYTFNNQVIGINDGPDPYLEENNVGQ